MAFSIGYLSLGGCDDRSKSSGTPYFISQALTAAFGRVVDLSPRVFEDNSKLHMMHRDPRLLARIVLAKACRRRRPEFLYSLPYQRRWARRVEALVQEHNPSIIYADKCSPLLRFLNLDVPILYRSDTTFLQMQDYYEEFGRLSQAEATSAHEAEAAALDKCIFYLPITKWALAGAARYYGISEKKSRVVRSHASLARERDGVSPRHPARDLSRPVRFLFIGGDWKRKGGDIALEIVEHLLRAGIRASMTVLSQRVPQHAIEKEFVEHVRFVDRSTKEGEAIYWSYFDDADFFLMPTEAECMGQVFVDALMSGLPSIAYDTGGVGEVVLKDRTGLLFELGSTSQVISDAVGKLLLKDGHGKYAELSRNSLAHYEAEFSRARWEKEMREIIELVN